LLIKINNDKETKNEFTNRITYSYNYIKFQLYTFYR
jgi:hypothetical protein